MPDIKTALVKLVGSPRVMENEMLAPYTSFRIGGPASYFVKAQTKEELIAILRLAQTIKFPYFILGGGTNLLVSDKGYRGLVIKNETAQIRLAGVRGMSLMQKQGQLTKNVFLEIDSGVAINRLVRYSIDQKLSGLEDFLGQPGTVGGAVYINAHNVKGKIYFGDKIISAKVFSVNGRSENRSREYFRFGYDRSLIQKTRETVLTVTVKLENIPDSNELWQKAKQAQEYRFQTQPKGFSAGCIFRNFSQTDAMRLTTPMFTTSAGYLIDRLGLKGEKRGQAIISDQHANFIINLGGACASDVLELINLVIEKVHLKYRLKLALEIVLLGEF